MTRRTGLTLVVLAMMVAGSFAASPAQAYVRGCGWASGWYVAVNSVTSCPFGRNVAREVARGNRNPRVYSPVTGRTYRMYCSRWSSRKWVCRGGNNAYVRLTR